MQLPLPLQIFVLAIFAEASASGQVPTFTIDLDLPPRKRWQKVAQFYRPWYRDHNHRLDAEIPGDPFTKENLAELGKNVSREVREEVRGIVEALDHKNATVESFMRQQMFYELGFSEGFDCAGIVATKRDGTTIHGRNLDLGAMNEDPKFGWVKEITYYAEFVKGGRLIAKALTMFGTVGILTGVHFGRGGGAWTVEQNTRLELNENFGRDVSATKWAKATLEATGRGGAFTQLEARRLLLEQETFEDAVDAFARTPWAAPQYFVLAGSKRYQGAVVTVDRVEAKNTKYDIVLLSEASGAWFLVQTNDDHWSMALDERRGQAMRAMTDQKGWTGIAEGNVMNALRSWPVCHPNTIFSWVFTPSTKAEQLKLSGCPKRR